MDAKGPEQQQRAMSQEEPVGRGVVSGDSTDPLRNMEAEALLSNAIRQTEFLDMVSKLRTSLEEATSECGSLRIKLSESDERAAMLGRELDGCRLIMFQNNEDSKKLHEEVTKSKKLEEDYVKLMSSYLNLEERYEQHRQNLYNTYLAKTNAINNYECIMSREVIKHELEEKKLELHQKSAELSLVSAKLRNYEEELGTKENCISELRKSLDDAKVAHKHEITVLEDYIQCLKNTITSYEKTLVTYRETRQPGLSARSDPEGNVPPVTESGRDERSSTATQTNPGVGAKPPEENGDI